MAAAKKKKTATKKKKSAKGKSLGAKTKGEAKSASSKAKTYDPGATYKKGDLVYHPFWQDEGPVVETGKTADGIQKAIVDFAEVGLKHLVMAHDLKI
jgi:hypothetical protein